MNKFLGGHHKAFAGFGAGGGQKGQTMIETLAAIFILVMGIAAAVGLAIFAYNSSTAVTKQIIAVGLAREGIEAAKNMRDTNWLRQVNPDTDCYDYNTGNSNATCYRSWLTAPFNLDPSPSGNYLLRFDPGAASPDFWQPLEAVVGNKYGLEINRDVNDVNFKGFYYHPAIAVPNGSSNFYRKVVLTKDTTAPYNTDFAPKLKVKSQVWWTDNKCPRSDDWPGTGKCSIEMEIYLTNWKNQ